MPRSSHPAQRCGYQYFPGLALAVLIAQARKLLAVILVYPSYFWPARKLTTGTSIGISVYDISEGSQDCQCLRRKKEYECQITVKPRTI